MNKKILIVFTFLFLNGCANPSKSNTTIFEDIATETNDIILKDKEVVHNVSCVGNITLPRGKEIHFDEVLILNDHQVFFREKKIRDEVYRYHVISKEYVENIQCEDQNHFNNIISEITDV